LTRKRRKKKKIKGRSVKRPERKTYVNIITLKQIEKQAKRQNFKQKSEKSNLNDQTFEENLNATVEDMITEGFEKYVEDLKNKAVLLRSKDDPSIAFVVRPYKTSRYSPTGQKKLSKKVKKQFNGVESGVFLTLTFNPHRVSLVSAWSNLSSLIKRTMKYLKTYAQREAKAKGFKLNVQYIWVIEVQKNGYPHVHVFYPSIKRLIDVRKIRQVWGVGYVFIEKLEGVRVGEYMSKYLSKGQGLEKALPYVWFFGIRLYGASNMVVLKDTPKGESKYVFIGMCFLDEEGKNLASLEALMRLNNINIVKDFDTDKIILSLT
jgi:hypothetical protein